MNEDFLMAFVVLLTFAILGIIMAVLGWIWNRMRDEDPNDCVLYFFGIIILTFGAFGALGLFIGKTLCELMKPWQL